MDQMICLDHVSHSFGKKQILKDINLKMKSGQIFGLIGPSGSGKTTLIKTIIGMIKPSGGKVVIQGREMPYEPSKQQIGYMAQSDALYGELTAKENLEFFAAIYGVKGKARQEEIEKRLKEVDLLEHRDKPVQAFSGGMKRRLSLAASLLHHPSILILDEPTVGIDPLLRKEIWRQFKQLKERGTLIIVTTHVMDEAEKCDVLGLLRDGMIIGNGSPEQLMEQANVGSIEEVFLTHGGMGR
ncbi:heme ABC exporter ATP-binding protein CcmA [Radiobacillus deserti]|uniref:Heme ABC exporter ATP-binding protein CcmA n=1 Tax=Radiobacillus deserti TaxID=2594883 RepID=A0A516KCG5_9BACI|nr:heme ABC exporter ATP-binding protein CcmA [Radiobacillus deserti]QDP39089.1 heme ABC exporter ATP-binding protein CcmA [Radiobacillus deserti]